MMILNLTKSKVNAVLNASVADLPDDQEVSEA